MMSEDREHRIRQRAHEIWEHEGRPSGRDREHWERARQDIDGGTDTADQQQAAVEAPDLVDPSIQGSSQAAAAAKAKKTVDSGKEKAASGSTAPLPARGSTRSGKPGAAK
jgi:hypothetical protein